MQFNKKSIINDLQRVEQFMNQKTKLHTIENEYRLNDYIPTKEMDLFETAFNETYTFYLKYEPIQSIVDIDDLLIAYQKKNTLKSHVIFLNDDFNSLATLIEEHKDKIAFNLTDLELDSIRMLNEKCTEIRNRTSHIQLWVEFNQILNTIFNKGLVQLISDYREGLIEEERLVGIFRYNLAKQIIDKTIIEDNIVQNFNSFNEESKIQLYTNLINDFTNLTIQEIMARVTEYYPSNVDHYAESNIITKFNKVIQKVGKKYNT